MARARAQAKKKDLVVEVRREYDGKVYSQVRDRNRDPFHSLAEKSGPAVVIDRQSGRHMDSDTIQYRASALSELLGLPFDVDLTWPCGAERGWPCRCPKCTGADRG